MDTIPLVGEKTLAQAVDAVTRLPRVEILVLAGSIMGGAVSESVDWVKTRRHSRYCPEYGPEVLQTMPTLSSPIPFRQECLQ